MRRRIPSYREHSASGQAIVTLDGRMIYLGRHGSKASKIEYDRVTGEWMANGRRLPAETDCLHDITINEVLAAFLNHARRYYVKDGSTTSEFANFKCVLRPLKRLYGRTRAAEFGPLALKAVRGHFIERGLCRNVVNAYVNRIKRIFKWAVANELVPPSIYQALGTVAGLRRGRSNARETRPVRPVVDVNIEAVRPFVSDVVWAMIRLQCLTGMRSGEVTAMRACDLDTSGKPWIYRPASHKLEHHGTDREIDIGPKAQEIIRTFLKPDTTAHFFSPSDAEAKRRAQLHSDRKTPLSCGNRPGSNRRRKPRRQAGEMYTSDSYRRAIQRACDQAFPPPENLGELERSTWRKEHRWHPHQLRHTFGTQTRKEHGVEIARILLGHSKMQTTEIYAEADRAKAREVIMLIG